jgi:hypothetical protein
MHEHIVGPSSGSSKGCIVFSTICWALTTLRLREDEFVDWERSISSRSRTARGSGVRELLVALGAEFIAICFAEARRGPQRWNHVPFTTLCENGSRMHGQLPMLIDYASRRRV